MTLMKVDMDGFFIDGKSAIVLSKNYQEPYFLDVEPGIQTGINFVSIENINLLIVPQSFFRKLYLLWGVFTWLFWGKEVK